MRTRLVSSSFGKKNNLKTIKMKRQLFLSAALLLSASAAMAQSGTFSLKANIKNLGDTIIVYKGRGEKRDTILVKKDKFAYTANLDAPKQLMFAKPEVFHNQSAYAIQLVCVPGEKVELAGDAKDKVNMKGSNFYLQYNEVDAMQDEARKELDELGKSISAKMAAGGDKEALLKEYDEKEPALRKAQEDKLMSFIGQHPDYEACATLIDQFETVDQMQKAIGLLSDNVKNGRMKAYYQPILDRAKKRAEMEEKAKKVQASGVEAADFTLKDINGKDLSLSSLRGKYVVLDFWGSWCIWCIKGMPKMKEYYEKYKGKFEILGVDCNDTEAKWKTAIEKHQLPWLHVYNPKTSDVLNKYAIQGFPTKIIVGPDGKIVKTIVGEDPAFYTFLDETFGK